MGGGGGEGEGCYYSAAGKGPDGERACVRVRGERVCPKRVSNGTVKLETGGLAAWQAGGLAGRTGLGGAGASSHQASLPPGGGTAGRRLLPARVAFLSRTEFESREERAVFF